MFGTQSISMANAAALNSAQQSRNDYMLSQLLSGVNKMLGQNQTQTNTFNIQVDGAENPHIETARIAAEPPAGQIDFVSGDEGRGNLPESEGRRSQESLETTERRLVGLSRPKLSVRLQMPDSILREAGQVLRIFPHNTISKNRINYR